MIGRVCRALGFLGSLRSARRRARSIDGARGCHKLATARRCGERAASGESCRLLGKEEGEASAIERRARESHTSTAVREWKCCAKHYA